MTLEQNNNYKALGITLAIHILILALLLLVKFQMPIKNVLDETFLEVDLGTSDDGFGDQQPEMMEGPAPENASQNSAAATNAENTINSSDDVNAEPINIPKKPVIKKIDQKVTPTVKTPSNNKNNSNTNTRSNTNTATARNPKYTYPGGQGEGGNSASRNNPGGSQGDGSGTGDKGTPGGIVGGRYISAVPNLKGRSLRTRPDPNATFNEGGSVKVSVVVDRDGNILRYSILSAANSRLKQIVEQKIKSVTFTKSSQAPPEQSGTITFNFKTVAK